MEVAQQQADSTELHNHAQHNEGWRSNRRSICLGWELPCAVSCVVRRATVAREITEKSHVLHVGSQPVSNRANRQNAGGGLHQVRHGDGTMDDGMAPRSSLLVTTTAAH